MDSTQSFRDRTLSARNEISKWNTKQLCTFLKKYDYDKCSHVVEALNKNGYDFLNAADNIKSWSLTTKQEKKLLKFVAHVRDHAIYYLQNSAGNFEETMKKHIDEVHGSEIVNDIYVESKYNDKLTLIHDDVFLENAKEEKTPDKIKFGKKLCTNLLSQLHIPKSPKKSNKSIDMSPIKVTVIKPFTQQTLPRTKSESLKTNGSTPSTSVHEQNGKKTEKILRRLPSTPSHSSDESDRHVKIPFEFSVFVKKRDQESTTAGPVRNESMNTAPSDNIGGTPLPSRPLPAIPTSTTIDKPIVDKPEFNQWILNVSREQSVQMLKGAQNGSFLFRPTKQPNCLCTLVVMHNQCDHHINVRQNADGSIGLGTIKKDNHPKFFLLVEIVKHFQKHELTLVVNDKILGAIYLHVDKNIY